VHRGVSREPVVKVQPAAEQLGLSLRTRSDERERAQAAWFHAIRRRLNRGALDATGSVDAPGRLYTVNVPAREL
jgi:hypothetical protein